MFYVDGGGYTGNALSFRPADLLQRYSGNMFSGSRGSDLIQEIALSAEVRL